MQKISNVRRLTIEEIVDGPLPITLRISSGQEGR